MHIRWPKQYTQPPTVRVPGLGGEKTDKVGKNIPEALVGNMTAVMIKTKMEAIKGERRVKE